MLITCTSRGCMKQSDAKLNRETGEVVCMECGNPITNVSPFMKRTLQAQGQVLRSVEKKPFQVDCATCGAKRDAELAEDGKSACCAVCKSALRLSAAFLHGLKLHLAEREKEREE
jgi:hypothetical protein